MNLPTAYDAAGRGGTVLDTARTVDPDTGEVTVTATVLAFGRPSGRDAVRVPSVETITVAQITPPAPRHNQARALAGWLAAQRTRSLPSHERRMVEILVHLVGKAAA